MFSVSEAVNRTGHAQRGQEMYDNYENIFTSNKFRLFRPPRDLPLEFLRWGPRHASLRIKPPVNCIGKQDFPHPSPEPVLGEDEDEDFMRMSWKQILQLLTRWDPLIHYSTWSRQLELAMNDTTTGHAMLAMRLPERNILKDLS